MTYTSRPTRACLRSTEIPKNHADDFENDRFTREFKPTSWVGKEEKKLTTALGKHYKNAKGKKAHVDKIALWNCNAFYPPRSTGYFGN